MERKESADRMKGMSEAGTEKGTERVKIAIRKAVKQDASAICMLMKELAEYEGVPEKMHTTAESLGKVMGEPHGPEAFLCEAGGEAVGFGIYAYTFSSFSGKKGIYIDDLYIREEYRGRGLGTQLFARIAQVAMEQDCGRIDWYCMKTNTEGKAYYDQSLMAERVDWIHLYRLSEEQANALGAQVRDDL